MRARRVPLYLNPTDERQNRVLEYLRTSGLSASEAVTTAVVGYLEHQAQESEKKKLLEEVKATVLEALSQGGATIPGPSPQQEADDDVSNEAAANDFLSFFRK